MAKLIELRTPTGPPEWPPMAVCACCPAFGNGCPGPCDEDFGARRVAVDRRESMRPLVESMTAALVAGLTDQESE